MHLFGGTATKPSEPIPTVAQRKPKKKLRDFVPALTTRAPGAPGGAPVQASFYINVIGDSLGVSAAEGLTEAFANRPEIAVIDKSRDASGLVRDDYFDWTKSANEFAAAKDKIDVVVVMLGLNDGQPLKDGVDTLDPLSDRWLDRYGQRVENLITPFRLARIPLLWVGLPPMRTERLNGEAIKLNELYRQRAERAGAKYIDIWDAFANQNGQYDAFGPNVDGQNTKLRGVDGIHFTKAGARKVAQFLESEIRRLLDKNKATIDIASLPPDIEQAADDINAQIRREMDTTTKRPPLTEAVARPAAGPILSLTARPLSPGAALENAESGRIRETEEAARVLHDGEPVESRVGRADDFSWPRL